ncbi:transporter [Streptomyces chrestomyceticus JCM 4735]|uniref:Transporter n=2 Tax=Streptomyces chrestomyceticus TaxID=68185 RepID=A0A7U9Q0N2_9ACTN|nr:transporter [Streptomyces chrestomyceticus JCM 4735]
MAALKGWRLPRKLRCNAEANMQTMLGVRFLASEYGTGPVHGGRIDSLGLDENDAPPPSGALVASGIRSPR